MSLLLPACSSEGDGIESSAPVISGAADSLEGRTDEVRELARMFELATEPLVGACMREAGFDYLEVVVPASGVPDPVPVPSDDQGEPDPSSLDQAGLGALQIQSEYVESLSETDRRAYGTALLGKESDGEVRIEMPTGDSIDFLTGGCLGKARVSLLTYNAFVDIQMFLGTFEGMLFLLSDATRSSRDYGELLEQMRQCLEAEGYDDIDLEGIESNFYLDLEEVEQDAAKACSRQLEVERLLNRIRDREASQILADYEASMVAWDEEISDYQRQLRQLLGITGS